MTVALMKTKMTSERVFISYPVSDFRKIKLQMLNWCSRFNIFCFLDNHEYPSSFTTHECLLAAGEWDSLSASAGSAFKKLRDFSLGRREWMFGHFAYDLKNETEKMYSAHPDGLQFPDLYFFIPEFILELNQDQLKIGTFHRDHSSIFKEIMDCPIPSIKITEKQVGINARFSRQQYVETVNQLGLHILRGDCYEINFCQEFFAEDARLDPVLTYLRLSQISPTPFAAFYRIRDKWLLCASPERYLKRSGDTLISQPIKGTRLRNPLHAQTDDQDKEALYYSGKDRSENVMVVDLVRNDLSKICLPGSVKVDELFGIYSFPQVHQMISSISGKIGTGGHWVDCIEATFPIGSMTGAPKKRVLELIEQYENRKRGLFSGAVGYVNPEGDFDFNVVIRSIFYNKSNRYLSYQAGSAITFYSDAQQEYEECLLKVSAIKKVLTAGSILF